MLTNDFKKEISENFKSDLNIDDILKYINDKMPTPIITNFNAYTPSIDVIMELTKQKVVDVERLHKYDEFDLNHPTDYSKPNFISSIQKFNTMEMNERQKKDIRALYSKSINPIRMSMDDALFLEKLTQQDRIKNLMEINGGKVSDLDLEIERMLFISFLSPEAYAACFFCHDKYIGENSLFFNDDHITVRPFQKAFLNSNNNHIALLVNRQDGKSTILQIIMTWYLIFRPGFRGFYIAQTDAAVKNFMTELFKKGGATKIHPYITGEGVSSNESFGELKTRGVEYNLHYKMRVNGELSHNESIIKMAYARGDTRFTGTTIQGLFFDEIATYDVDPTGIINPTLDTFKHLAFSYYTTTQRDGGNPFIPIMNRPDVRLFQRNIWFAYHTGYKTDEDLQRAKDKTGGDVLKWQTEYECVIPESSSSLLTLTDLIKSGKKIDNLIMADATTSTSKKKITPWEMRDERIFDYYDLIEYTIGVDWNQEVKGNLISVVATLVKKDKNNDEDIKKYEYALYDYYHITGNQYMYNTLVTVLLLMDLYNVPKFQADAGYATAIKQILAISPELHKTKNGKIVFIPGPNGNDSEYPGIEFISFQRMVQQETVDSFNTTHVAKMRLREALITTLISLIKKDKIIFSPYETNLYSNKLLQSENFTYIGDEVDIMRDDAQPTIKRGSRILNVSDLTAQLNIYELDPETFIEKVFETVPDDYTAIDELKNLKFKAEQKKYISPTKGTLSELEDDKTIAFVLSLYPSIQKYESYLLEGVEDTEVIDKKAEDIKRTNENILKASLGLYGGSMVTKIADLPDVPISGNDLISF